MSEGPEGDENSLPTPLAPSLNQLASGELYRHDIFFALVAPLGSNRKDVIDSLKSVLDEQYDYAVERVHLAGLLDEVPSVESEPLPARDKTDYHKRRMNAGDDLRDEAGDHSALAAVAVARVARLRAGQKAIGADERPRPTAYIFDSLKHPREAELLRNVYGSALWVVSIVEDLDERVHTLAVELAQARGQFDAVPEAQAIELITRDEADVDAKHGQQVRDVFGAADFFLPVTQGGNWREKVERLCRGVFGAPFLTPRASEEAMRFAQAAALRSAAIGRQVGAAIVPPSGGPFLLGTNEVPKPGGGQYREGDQPDHRDFQGGSDPNPAYTQRVIREVVDRFVNANYFTSERNERGGAAILKEALTAPQHGRAVLDGTRAKSLIEFTRCLHAEQAAIVDAARTGTAIGGGKLYTTTFPCHECAKFIVGAGIVSVEYIEPYAKSLVKEMYRDLIDARPPQDDEEAESEEVPSKVPFRAFVGFAPSRYDEVFTAKERRAGSALAKHVPRKASPVGSWSEVKVVDAEDQVVIAVAETFYRLEDKYAAIRAGLAITDEAEGRADAVDVEPTDRHSDQGAGA